MKFKIDSKFSPAGDQPQAISKLVQGLKKAYRFQTLLGVTGSGKTFTIANVIEKIQKPTLVIVHNKTLAAQIAAELRSFFPKNAVEYFVSYYDYYQPEAYLETTDVYIEKEVEINQEIERLRHAATQALLMRQDVIIVASVSCIYGLGSPEVYRKSLLSLKVGQQIDRRNLLERLISMYFSRSEVLVRGKFRLRGNTLEIMPADQEIIIRIEFQNSKIVKITRFEAVSFQKISQEKMVTIYPAKHFVVDPLTLDLAIEEIKSELGQRLEYFKKQGKILEAERLQRRTQYDLELLREIGYCPGIENYSRYLTGRKPGEAPYTLIDYFGNDFLLVIDESHVTLPQLGGMFEGDFSRKKALVDNGFRLPSAFDNRPLKFKEFLAKINQVIFTTATPSNFERKKSGQIVEQIIRPTGLVDPQLEVRQSENQIDDLIQEINQRINFKERILVTALTKRMAEDLAEYLKEKGIRAEYLHSEIDTLDRIGILENLRRGKFDCLVGVNLLREGLDLPEVSLVAILDADKEGFLRSEVSLIQTIGRAARNVRGKVILYADNITGSMKRAIDETNRRRQLQIAYNRQHHITPKTIQKAIQTIIDHELKPEVAPEYINLENLEDLPAVIRTKQAQMKQAAHNLRFEEAAMLRDEIVQMKKLRLR